ncbi:hypothetical protein ACHWQZ_G000044 [Mnemiopsis leidyi]
MDQGFETKVNNADTNREVRVIFRTEKHSKYFHLQLWGGRYEFQSCTPGNLNMSLVRGTIFILKIYRREACLKIDLDEENQIEFDTSASCIPDCYNYWGGEEINQFQYDPVSENVVTHYRTHYLEDSSEVEDNSDNDSDSEDGSDSEEDNILDWKNVEMDKVVKMDLDQGFKTKIVYDSRLNPNTQVRIILYSESESRWFQLNLWDGGCLFQGCTGGTLDLSGVEDGIPFILNIHREKEKLSIELGDNEKVEVDISSVHCSGFWKLQDIVSLQYDTVSKNVVTHYLIPASDNEEDEEDGEDGEDEEEDGEDEEEDKEDGEDEEEEEDKEDEEDEEEEEDKEDGEDEEEEEDKEDEEDEEDKEDEEDEEEEEDKEDEEDEEEEEDKEDGEDEEEEEDKEDEEDEEEEEDKEDEEDEEEEEDKEDGEDEEEEDNDNEDDGDNEDYDFPGKCYQNDLIFRY